MEKKYVTDRRVSADTFHQPHVAFNRSISRFEVNELEIERVLEHDAGAVVLQAVKAPCIDDKGLYRVQLRAVRVLTDCTSIYR